MKELIEQIQQWAQDRGIYDKSTVVDQLKITAEEVVEAVEAWLRYRTYLGSNLDFPVSEDFLDNTANQSKQELGDIGVTLINACHLAGFTLEECLAAAHEKNMKRTKGKMVNGKWVKG